MAQEEKDQVVEETIDGQSEDEQSEETKEEPLNLGQVAELAKGLQKGYTITRQELSEMKENLQSIANAINEKSGAEKGDEEYITVGKLKEILAEQSQQQIQRQEASDSIVASVMADLQTKGVIKSEEDEEAFTKFVIAHPKALGNPPDLENVAEIWAEIQIDKEKSKDEARKESAKTKAQQEEGSKIGTSSKTSVSEQGGVNYAEIRKKDWYEF